MNHLSAKQLLARMFEEAARQIRTQSEMLSKLDSAGGDGDHGETMVRAMEAVGSAIDVQSKKTASVLLKEAGWAVMNVDGGASSALLGTFIAGMGSVEIGDEFNSKDLANSLDAGLGAVMRQTRARAGDRTLMDALIPAVEAFREAVEAGSPAERGMTLAAASAEAGAKSTSLMVAQYGRSRSFGERALGHPDPGAVSIAILFAGFRVALNSLSDGEDDV